MKIFLYCLLACFFAAQALAVDIEIEKKQANPGEISTMTGKKNTEKQAAQPGWPRPYSPSEEISADSIVDFPADI